MTAKSIAVFLLLLTCCLTSHAREATIADLVQSCREGDILRVKKIVGAGVDVQGKNSDGWSPLLIAAVHGQTRVVAYLLEKKSEINEQSARKNTPLIFAASRGHLDTVKLLLKEGADKTLVSGEGLDAAGYAASAGYNDVAELINSHP